VLLVSRAV